MSAPDSHDRQLEDLRRVRRVRDRMDREFELPLNVPELARGVNMSTGHLSRLFRGAYGETPYAYLLTRRIERAMALLRNQDYGVRDCAFRDPSGNMVRIQQRKNT